MSQTTSLESYKKLLFELKVIRSQRNFDAEFYHIEQDKIYRKFIKDISSGKLNKLSDIQTISKLLKKEIVNHDKNLWYS